MRKKSIVITVIIALVYISSWMTWGYVHKNDMRRNKKLIEDIRNLYRYNTLLEQDLLQSNVCFHSLSPHLKLYTEKNDSIHLSDIRPHGVTLVFRYSIYGCTPCIDSAISKVKEFARENPDIELLTFATYTLPVELRNFKRLNKEFRHIYHVPVLDLPMDEEDTPYLFLLNDKLQVTDVFFIRKEFHSLTDAYLKNVKEFFHKTIKAYCNTDSPLQIFATGEVK